MSFGKNLQFLRKMRNTMTQEDLAERMGVSRQTVSKWELDMAYPEMEKVLELCRLFSCTMDQLIREDMGVYDEAYSDIRIEQVDAFRYIRYAVISTEPESDAIDHVRKWAESLNIAAPRIIGWDFPVLSQEQINVHNMHGYAAALILEDGVEPTDIAAEVIRQEAQKYIAITIRDPFSAPFTIIPNAYKALDAYMRANGIQHRGEGVIPCFEKEYSIDGVDYMDVCIAVED
ncbi:MAG: helix-turn-helix domain-containing protein [Ruminococcaceae bacterium]|nr:helix-turn-helix domain-containing protein [Oscillospiraceae bacterium]